VSVVHPQANDHKIREPAPIRIVGKVRVDLVGDAPPEIDADAALGAVLRLHRKGRRDLRAHDQAPTLRAVPASGPGLRRLGKHRPQRCSHDNGANSRQSAPFLAFHAPPYARLVHCDGLPD